MNAFEILGLKEKFDIDDELIDSVWKERMKLVHPDLFANKSSAEKLVAEQWSVSFNDARNILKNPILRAKTILWNHGIDLESNRNVDIEFLNRQFCWNEELEKGNNRIKEEIKSVYNDMIDNLKILFDNKKDYESAKDIVKKLIFIEKLL